MNWKLKAFIQRSCAALPGGAQLYYRLQRHFGGLRQLDISGKLQRQRSLAQAMVKHGMRLVDAEIMEVGTGWAPIVPFGFWVCGVGRVWTFDLHRHLRPEAVRRMLTWVAEHRLELHSFWGGLAPRQEVLARIKEAVRLRNDPEKFLRLANIEYLAPADAAHTDLPNQSIHAHISTNVFEHIPPEVLMDILTEARRVLQPHGLLVHHVDPSDHFAHCDRNISSVNFVRFESDEWSRYNDNPFAYHNRLREPDFRRMIAACGFGLVEANSRVDMQALNALLSGLPVASCFIRYSHDDLCRYDLDYVARPLQVIPSVTKVIEQRQSNRMLPVKLQ